MNCVSFLFISSFTTYIYSVICEYIHNYFTKRFLIKTFPSRVLKEYIKSYFCDERVLNNLRTKDQMAHFIAFTFHNYYEVKTCDICYCSDKLTRVHKCTLCTFLTCSTCLHSLHYPVSCPQCKTPLRVYELSNILIKKDHIFEKKNAFLKYVYICLCFFSVFFYK